MLKPPERYSARRDTGFKAWLVRNFSRMAFMGAVIVIFNVTFRYLWVYPTVIQDDAMAPSITPGTRVFLRDAKIDSITRGAIVKVRHQTAGTIFCRVSATEGETFELRDGKVFVNGNQVPSAPISDSTVFPASFSLRDNYKPITLRPGYFFCLADNHEQLYDSRTFGPFEARNVEAKVYYISWLGKTL